MWSTAVLALLCMAAMQVLGKETAPKDPPTAARDDAFVQTRPTMLSYYVDEGGIPEGDDSAVPDIRDMFKECFPRSSAMTREAVRQASKRMNLFFMVDNGRPVGFIEWILKSYVSADLREYRALEMYGVCISKEDRGQGLELPLVLKSMANLQKHYSLADDTIVGLHLSHWDECMSQAYNLYVKLGFSHHVELCNFGPSDIAPRVEILFDDKRRSPLSKTLASVGDDVEKALAKNKSHNLFFCMYRLLRDTNYATGNQLQTLFRKKKGLLKK